MVKKFRAWDKNLSGWIAEKIWVSDDVAWIRRGDALIWIEADVTQFTGLLDKNGKKVFEGDILQVRDHKGECRIIELKFENHHIGDFHNWEIHGFRDYSKSTYGYTVEIIGNIYENPELLEKEVA